MSMRLQELHPALVHFPIALLPVAVGADLLGRATGSRTLLEAGRVGIQLAAGSAVVSAVAGLAAQEAVHAEGEAHDVLVTHRTLNIGLTAASLGMAAWRAGRRRPTTGYLALGLAALGVMGYSAYLGGHMVYELGVGVREAGGLNEARAPEVVPGQLAESARVGAANVADGARHAAGEMAGGELLPYLTGRTGG